MNSETEERDIGETNLYSFDRTQTGKKKKHICFRLGKEHFSIPLGKIKEVIELLELTPIPNAPDYIRGLINLRGNVITVIDLRLKLLNVKEVEDVKRKTSIIISFIDGVPIGFVVDQVIEVINYAEEDICSIDSTKAESEHVDFVTGVAKDPEKNLIFILDLEKVINMDNINLIVRNS